IPVVQRFADKTVVNVQQSILTVASSIFDVIQRSPTVQVDQDDNIKMVGKSGVTVMIDGKITPMSGSDLANMLRGMPADAVDKIEFITNPSAKYDANGTAGIINIILKKDKRIGTNGTINISYGQGVYARTNDGFSLNSRTKNFNFFMNANYSYSENFHNAPRTRDFSNGNEFIGGYSETDYHTIPSASQTARLGADFFASKSTTIGFIADGMNRVYTASGNTIANVFDSAYKPVSYNNTYSDVKSSHYNYSGNFNLNHKFDSLGREIVVNIDYADFTSHTTQSFVTNYYDLNNNIVASPYLLYGDVPGQLNIYSFKADYDGQLGKKGTLEAGIKTSYVKTDNNLKFYDGINSSAPLDTGQSNHFIYSENINAVYATYSRSMGKANIQLGLRAEQTIANGDQVTTNQLLHINSFQLFPNFDFNDSISKNSQLGISFSRRLDRPTYEQLNPFRNYVDPSTYAEGNPLLLPQYAYSLQVVETYKQNYSISVIYARTTGIISSVWMPVTGNQEPVIAESQVNLSYNDNYGGNITLVCPFAKWWTSTNILDGYYTHYNADYLNAGLNTTKFFWDVSSDNLFTLKSKLSIDVNGSYTSGWDDGYLYAKPSGNVSIGVQKKILKNKGTIKLNATDIFYTSNMLGYAIFTGYIENYDIKRDTRVVSIAFSYHFGGSSTSRSMRSKGGAEDEKKRAGGTS
ncbi:MAG TPA: outer membrane beta-barrel protein, partial [Bacteroidia bacterium]|nr:outer membrane beta-barrel protein [Bacteroidia bacterium]